MACIAIICTNSIPCTTFGHFLDGAKAFLAEYRSEASLSGAIKLVARNPEDYDLPQGRLHPPFRASFEGETPDDIRPWFQANCLKIHKYLETTAFIILDSQTVVDSSSCLLVVCPNEFEPAQTIRCAFYVAVWEALMDKPRSLWDREESMYIGALRRSKIIMTEGIYDAAADAVFLPIVNGVFEINEGTRDGEDIEDPVEHD